MDTTRPDLIRAMRAPAMLIATGALFAADHFTSYGFWRTWPALLIVFGLFSLLGREGGGER